MNILMSNYTHQHINFNKGEYVGHLEPPIDEISQSSANPDSPTAHGITMERMMVERKGSNHILSNHHVIS